MSDADRDKWNQRYAEGAYAERLHPSALLEAWADKVAPGPALDVACGAGRNSLWLAERGFEVTGVDIAAAGLGRAQAEAGARGLSISLVEQDLENPLGVAGDFQLIVMIRYVNLPLLASLAGRLLAGGWLICEQHMLSDADVIGPGTPAYRVAPGALAAAVPDLAIQWVGEGLVEEPDGRMAALSQLVARRLPEDQQSS